MHSNNLSLTRVSTARWHPLRRIVVLRCRIFTKRMHVGACRIWAMSTKPLGHDKYCTNVPLTRVREDAAALYALVVVWGARPARLQESCIGSAQCLDPPPVQALAFAFHHTRYPCASQLSPSRYAAWEPRNNPQHKRQNPSYLHPHFEDLQLDSDT